MKDRGVFCYASIQNLGAAFLFTKQFFDIASSQIKGRQDLGLSVSESASLGAKTTCLSKSSLIGGDGEQSNIFKGIVSLVV